MAHRFNDMSHRTDIMLFASGVSNSKEIRLEAYEREVVMLKNALCKVNKQKFIYFSTCSIYDKSEQDSLYVKHKLFCEELISTTISDYLIFRVSNVVGKTNNIYTITNFLASNICNSHKFELWKNSVRNIIDIDDVYKIVTYIMESSKQSGIYVVANIHQYTVTEIVESFEKHYKKKAVYNLVEKGEMFNIPNAYLHQLAVNLAIDFSKESYLQKLIEKYY